MEKKLIFGQELPQQVKKEFESYPTLLGEMLFYRGITTFEEAELFLRFDYERDNFDPFLMKGMEKAVDRILEAVKKNEKIMIYSDYDADGIPGAVILSDFFKKIGFTNFENYIPNRLQEGYGLNLKAVKKFISEKVDLLITIDCGITNVEEIKVAQENSIDVILTDHHLVNEKLPSAFAILNPKQSDDFYPDKMLCGAGVVYKLIQALIKKGNFNLVVGWEKWLLDMVGLATIADMVPLRKENRVFAKYGLYVMQKSPRLGLVNLFRKMKIDQRKVNEDDIGFMIAPRINAASRVANPQIAFDLFSTNDDVSAVSLANQLDKLNAKRKILVATAVREAKRKIKERDLKEIIVVGNTEWNLGLSGLIASSLKDFYQRPCFVWCTDNNGDYCGSCRSETVNLVELMALVGDGFFTQTGGHKQAAGFKLSADQIYFFEEKILAVLPKLGHQPQKEELFVDKKLSLEDVTWDNYKLIEQLAPFGSGNQKPLFLFENVEIKTSKIFGKTNNHLELIFNNSKNKQIKAVDFFSQSVEAGKVLLKEKQNISILANFEKNTFGGNNELRLRVVEILL